ncbi:MAG: dihydroorotase [Thermodesulfobacteriota bacterium]
MKILIKNGRVIDPANNINRVKNILIDKDRIKSYPKNIKSLEQKRDVKVIDARKMVVVPGLVDIHVHLREPGYEHKETIKTGTLSAAAGGFTSIACMPNTHPINDNASVTDYILLKARTEGVVNVFPIGAITKNEEGVELAEIGEMYEAGCIGISDDGMPVVNSNLMRRAMEYVRSFNIPVLSHSEDTYLSDNGVMNEGKYSTLLGLRGIPNASEEVMIARDIHLSELTGTHLHICHVSAEGSVRIVKAAKKRGVKVTAEATPHHFLLSDEEVLNYNTNAKMNPPLRSKKDVKAIQKGLKDGTIDIIATDHAPHSADEKNVEFEKAPFGIVGLETALPLSLTLRDSKILTLNEIIEKLTILPSRIINIDRGTLGKNKVADVTIFDPNEKFTIDKNKFHSMGKNTPFDNWKLKGKVKHTIVSGKIVYTDRI